MDENYYVESVGVNDFSKNDGVSLESAAGGVMARWLS
jgi:hypothetical protein